MGLKFRNKQNVKLIAITKIVLKYRNKWKIKQLYRGNAAAARFERREG